VIAGHFIAITAITLEKTTSVEAWANGKEGAFEKGFLRRRR